MDPHGVPFPRADEPAPFLLVVDDDPSIARLLQVGAHSGGVRGPDGRPRGFAVGADDHVMKPFDPPALLERIREVLGRPARAARPA